MNTEETYRILKYFQTHNITSQYISYDELSSRLPNCPPKTDFSSLCYYTKYLEAADGSYCEFLLTPLGIEFISKYENSKKQYRMSKYAMIAACISAILTAITLLLTLI